MESQDATILKHLREYHSITSWDAIRLYHITRLSAKIFNLRGLGFDIKSIYERNEETGANYVRYYLIGEKA